MDGDTVTPAPEPGQPVWIAAEVVPSVAGHPMLTPITADGQPSTIRLAPARYRWHPADVPPQFDGDLLERLRKAMGDTWAGEEPVGADEAAAILDAVRTVLGIPPQQQPPSPKPIPVWERSGGYVIRHPATPADVPPQPPVLATNMTVQLAGDTAEWVVFRWWDATEDRDSILVRLIRPADVPGPDDTTPAGEGSEQ